MRYLICLLFLIYCQNLTAQSNTTYKYWIHFTDKNNSEFSVTEPESFLSQRAIDRRENYNIPITIQDLPVNTNYIEALEAYPIEVLKASKWFNALVISIDSLETDILSEIEALAFVNEIELLAQYNSSGKKGIDKFDVKTSSAENDFEASNFYGYSEFQIRQINGHHLHGNDFMGEGVHIAVMDAGFTRVDSILEFQHLYDENRLLGVFDFVENDSDPYHGSGHGTAVLSTMAAFNESVYVGTAPKASYWLLRTEDTGSEQRIEEVNWLIGAEFADSAGVDILNTSLGYSRFDLPEFDYTYDDMNGDISIITQAADIAAAKGMLVVNSAGNSGTSDWKYITAPADGDSVLTVGAINAANLKVGFSSFGPSSDGQIKPDIMALGRDASIISSGGNYSFSNGTSFSAPIISGISACLWQNNTEYNNQQIMNALRFSGTLSDIPNDSMGYGIPDLQLAYFILKGVMLENSDELLSSNSNVHQAKIIEGNQFKCVNTGEHYISIFDMNGRNIYESKVHLIENQVINITDYIRHLDIPQILVFRIIDKNTLYLKKTNVISP